MGGNGLWVMGAARRRAVGQTNDGGVNTEMQRGQPPGAASRRHTGQQVSSEGQAAIGVPVMGTWLRAGIATPALRRAATRFGRSGWEDISSTRLVQKFSQVSAPEVRQLVTHDEANRCLALIER